ncbi:biotin--[acetyl-CoA-carboxylase] ligase [Halorarius halobius]|uniref:biotin--[acetyl-CoA-carboxylase] ligase n=1 Tax=Halorarius halobius TaxID=2962671 RepID=UPI0020CED480|nr:biotin--[acetyl-CoA-carboxylase] ligase [Halorarius halobius]
MDEATLSQRLGVPVTVFESTPDTSAYLRREARDGAPHGTFAVANELTAARGRSGDGWAAPPGGVWSSTLLYPEFGPEHVGRLTFAAGVAVAEAARSFGVDAALKWPNDVVVEREGTMKLAGVLTEAVVDAVPVAGKPVDEALDDPGELECVVLGVGVNADLDPADLDTDRAVTTVRAETGGAVDREEVAARMHDRLLDRAARAETDEGFAAVLDDWRELSVTLDQPVRVELGTDETLVGTATDVDATGALLVETEAGRKRVTEGDCETLRRR